MGREKGGGRGKIALKGTQANRRNMKGALAERENFRVEGNFPVPFSNLNETKISATPNQSPCTVSEWMGTGRERRKDEEGRIK